MKKAIITGATSFIGVALIELLLEKGFFVYAVVRPNSSGAVRLSKSKNIIIISSELKDLNEISLEEIGKCEVLFHIGWSGDFENSRYNFKGQMKNVDYTIKATNLAINLGCKTFIGIGSQAECGLLSEKIAYDTHEKPETAYAFAKCIAAKESRNICEKNGVKHIWPRLLSAYGKNDRPHTLIMKCIEACIDKSEIELTPCQQIWDFIHVKDVARALFLIYEKGVHGKNYPIGSGDGRILKEFIEDIAVTLRYEDLIMGIGKKQYSQDQVMYLCADNTELIADTGFSSEISFKEGIASITKDL